MFSKPFLAVLFIAFLIWGGSIFVAGEPIKRIDRFCAPINWGNTLSTSVTTLAAPTYVGKVDSAFKSLFQNCRWVTWQMFYEADYQEMTSGKQDGNPE